jgi:hypothetical protein
MEINIFMQNNYKHLQNMNIRNINKILWKNNYVYN